MTTSSTSATEARPHATDEVKVYSGDTGHPIVDDYGGDASEELMGSESTRLQRCREQLSHMSEHCRERVQARPFTALALASFVSAAVGVCLGMKMHRSSRWHWH